MLLHQYVISSQVEKKVEIFLSLENDCVCVCVRVCVCMCGVSEFLLNLAGLFCSHAKAIELVLLYIISLYVQAHLCQECEKFRDHMSN